MTTSPVERLNGKIKNGSAPSIAVAADVLATDAWQDLVNATQADYHERGLVVGRLGKAERLIRSKVLQGYCELRDGADGEVEPASFPVPIFPFGIIRGLSPRLREDLVIHTHPMPPALDHLRTTPISDQDIRCFAGSRLNAMVMLDRGGAHLLARTGRYSFRTESLSASDLVDTATRQVIAESGGSMDVMARIASGLKPYGLGYYYTPDLSQPDATVEFQNLGHSVH